MQIAKAIRFLLCNLVFISTLADAQVIRSNVSAKMVDPEDCVGMLRRADRTRVRFGHWNFENFFDPFDNKMKDDQEFLPFSVRPEKPIRSTRSKPSIDWNRHRIALKLAQAQRMVKAMGKPPILSGVEVESQYVATLLARALGYQGFFITNSIDGRGVNVVTFFDEYDGIEILGHSEIPLTGETFSTHPSRSILELEILINGRHRVFFHNSHWPSQAGPPEARMAAAFELWKRTAQLARKYPDAEFVSTGDFNVIDEPSEDPHAIRFLEEESKETPFFVDLDRHIRQQTKLGADLPPGTYFYDKKEQWNVLDRWLLSSRLVHSKRKTGLKVDLSSYQIIAPKWASSKYALKDDRGSTIIPTPYNFYSDDIETAGFSDHRPIVMELVDQDEPGKEKK